MSRAINLNLTEDDARQQCSTRSIGISAIETLPDGGVRLVCMSSEGAGIMTRKFKQHLMHETPIREKFRPISPLW